MESDARCRLAYIIVRVLDLEGNQYMFSICFLLLSCFPSSPEADFKEEHLQIRRKPEIYVQELDATASCGC